mgnify:CR=1 FL=1
MSVAALDSYMLPLKQILDQDGVSEVSINEQKKLWVEKKSLKFVSESARI